MLKSSPVDGFDPTSEPGYVVKVRGLAYLWGSAGLKRNFVSSRALILHLRNGLFGETITLETRAALGDHQEIGTLAPGECASIPLNDIAGVLARCTEETTVHCVIGG